MHCPEFINLLGNMQEDDIEEIESPESGRGSHWKRSLIFLSLGLVILFLGSYLLMGKIGPEAFFVLLLWSLPLFVH